MYQRGVTDRRDIERDVYEFRMDVSITELPK